MVTSEEQKVPDVTVAGAKINKILRLWEKKKSKALKEGSDKILKPWRRGNMICLLFRGSSYEPTLTIGPDYLYSLAELLFFNLVLTLPFHI